MITIFILFILDAFIKNKYFIFAACFVAGIIFDYANFFPIGRSSIFLLIIFYVYYLYEKKFKANNLLFKICVFTTALIIFSILSSKFNFSQLFWWMFFYFLAASTINAYGK